MRSLAVSLLVLPLVFSPALTRDAAAEEPFALFGRELLAKAQPDECFIGVGLPYPPGAPECSLGVPKVNQAYIWGMTEARGRLWFGTMANTQCMVLGTYLQSTTPVGTPSWVCEFGQSQVAQANPLLPPAIGDMRPPGIFVYDTLSGTMTDKLQEIGMVTATTLGLRSAGSLGDMVFLAGPNILGGVDLFAFRADSGDYLGKHSFTEYANVRRWVVAQDELYTGMQAVGGAGRILRWTGSVDAPFSFEEVGVLDADPAELAEHEGRLFCLTWPVLVTTPPTLSGLWMSPLLPPDGLTADSATAWRRVWKADDYEPDPLVAATYGGGALASFRGRLYWGTMHVPFVAVNAFFQIYGTPATQEEQLEVVLNTWRAATIFRGRDFDTRPNIQVLYGEAVLPQYTPGLGWGYTLNNMGLGGIPRFGHMGFDNLFNNYTWNMTVFNRQLLVGTMDCSYLVDELLPIMAPGLGIDPADITLPPRHWGADLYRFVGHRYPAIPESLNGLDNFANYGIRTSVKADALYLGTANPMNLMTNLDDELPEGGWELVRLSPRVGAFPPAGPLGTEFSVAASERFGRRKGTVFVGGEAAGVLAWGPTSVLVRLTSDLTPGTYNVRLVTARGKRIVLKDAFTVTAD